MTAKDTFIALTPEARQFTQLAQSRARVYGTLSAIYSGLPGEQLVKLFSAWCTSEQVAGQVLPPLIKRGLNIINSWLEKCGSASSEIAALETEFTRLFRGLGREKSPPPPYESVYLDNGLLYGLTTQLVADIYRRFRITVKDNEPPDYIGMELDFMRSLCEREATARQSQDNVREIITAENDFLKEHLLTWVPTFCENIRRSDIILFYTGLADITEGWILIDQVVICDSNYSLK
jgi:TorA maturation chaperone TorD